MEPEYMGLFWTSYGSQLRTSITDLNYGSRLNLHLQRETHDILGLAGKEAGYGGWRPWQHPPCSRTRYHIYPAFFTKMSR